MQETTYEAIQKGHQSSLQSALPSNQVSVLYFEQGQNFYQELSESIAAFQSSLEDFCVALDIEKDDLVDDMGPPVFHDAKS